jgi:hypothetical protein
MHKSNYSPGENRQFALVIEKHKKNLGRLPPKHKELSSKMRWVGWGSMYNGL